MSSTPAPTAAAALTGRTMRVVRGLGPRPTTTDHLIVDATTDGDGLVLWYREDCGAGPYGITYGVGIEILPAA